MRTYGSPESGVTGSCEWPWAGTENLTVVFC